MVSNPQSRHYYRLIWRQHENAVFVQWQPDESIHFLFLHAAVQLYVKER